MSEGGLRNLIYRREHKERAQPREREHLGILEKRKDYKVRAEHDHRKRDYLKDLHRKAALRNPDEFAFAMINERTSGGIVVGTGDEAVELTPEQVRSMKLEDLQHIQRRLLTVQRQKQRQATEMPPDPAAPAPVVAASIEEAEAELARADARLREREIEAARAHVSAADLFGAALSGRGVAQVDAAAVERLRTQRAEERERARRRAEEVRASGERESAALAGIVAQLQEQLRSRKSKAPRQRR